MPLLLCTRGTCTGSIEVTEPIVHDVMCPRCGTCLQRGNSSRASERRSRLVRKSSLEVVPSTHRMRRQDKRALIIISIIFGVLVLVGIIIAVSKSGKSTQPFGFEPRGDYSKLPVIDATLLEETYQNEIAGNEKFKNQIIKIGGLVSEVKVGEGSKAYIAFLKPNGYSRCYVDAYLVSGQDKKVAKLQKGAVVIMVGKCVGKKYGRVELIDCELIE